MRRSGSIQSNMSYTNLAALAEGFENNQSHVLSSGSGSSADAQLSSESLLAHAMSHISDGMRVDGENPSLAMHHYHSGGDILQRALQSAPQGEVSDKMLTTLNMVEARVRDLARSALGRNLSESSSTSSFTASPEDGGSFRESTVVTAQPPQPPPQPRAAAQANNLFETDDPKRLPMHLRQARARHAAHAHAHALTRSARARAPPPRAGGPSG